MFLAVFYEQRPYSPDKTGTKVRMETMRDKHYCWELANYEIMINPGNIYNTDDQRSNLEMGGAYTILASISTVILMILFIVVVVTYRSAEGEAWQLKMNVFSLLICLVYVLISAYLSCVIRKCTSFRDDSDIKKKHLKNFITYSLETKHYSKKGIEDRFGKIILDSLDLS